MSRPEITCTIEPSFLAEQSSPSENVYAFAYKVTIVNTGDVVAQLIGRHWVIRDAHGVQEEVRGLAVVGHQPVLRPGEQFEYSSWTRIATPSGTMSGRFYCVTDEVQPFEAIIEPFNLDAADQSPLSPKQADVPRVLH